ncbi:hypothetical protein GF325_04540 [Candidatus Bathyarchaeota archaeon]|nr:hypothetical protein [Candidatus Bathyarchaeota archaeon]
MNIQKAGNAYSKGDVKKAKQVLGEVRAQVAEMDADEDVTQSLAFLDDEMEQIAEFEEQKVNRAPKSFSAAMGQKRSRISMKKKLQELKEDD